MIRRLLTHGFMAAWSVPLLLSVNVQAEDIQFQLAGFETRFAELESRMEVAEQASVSLGGEGKGACCDTHPAPAWYATAEALFFKYHRADGVRFDDANDGAADSSFEVSPRFTVGYARPDGLGIRARYWEYDQFFPAVSRDDGSGVSIDTYTIDLEVFDTVALNRNWTMEISGGLRYNDFEELLLKVNEDDDDSPHLNRFSGLGGIGALEFRRCVTGNVSLYGRARAGILMDDKFQIEDVGDDLNLADTVVGVTELAVGIEGRRSLSSGAVVFLRGGLEWQNWYNYSAGFEDSDSSDDMSGPADVGFGGLTLAIGVER